MIDFRYHIVSLISVFLALAVGIALGAGPLKEAIGDTLTGQVDQLRADKTTLRAELDTSNAALTDSQEAFAAAAPDLLDGVLAQRRVAVVQVDAVAPDVLEAVTSRLTEAGAQVTAVVQVAPKWTDTGQRAFRQSIAGTLVDYLDPAPESGAGADVLLADALADGLTTAAPADPDALAEDASIILQVLVEGGLVTVEADVTQAADAVVVLGGPTLDPTQEQAPAPATDEDVATEDERRAAVLAAGVQIATAADARSGGAVVAAGEPTDTSLVQQVRDDGAATLRVSTVEAVNTLVGQVSVPLALSTQIGGTVGHYGPRGDLPALPPRVVLPPVERVPAEVPVPGEPGVGDAAGTSGAGQG